MEELIKQLEKEIPDTIFSSKTWRCLTNAGVVTYGDLYFKEAELSAYSRTLNSWSTKPTGLLKLPSFGFKERREVELELRRNGFPSLREAYPIAFALLRNKLITIAAQAKTILEISHFPRNRS